MKEAMHDIAAVVVAVGAFLLLSFGTLMLLYVSYRVFG